MQNCGQVMRYAIATGRAVRNPVADLKGALAPAPDNNFAAVTDPKELGALLRAMHGYHGTPIVQGALQLAPMVFLRLGELCMAQWREFDLHERTWTIPAERMKMRRPHTVPLSD